MASTEMLTANALTVKRWEMTGWLNVGQSTALGRMFDKGGRVRRQFVALVRLLRRFEFVSNRDHQHAPEVPHSTWLVG